MIQEKIPSRLRASDLNQSATFSVLSSVHQSEIASGMQTPRTQRSEGKSCGNQGGEEIPTLEPSAHPPSELPPTPPSPPPSPPPSGAFPPVGNLHDMRTVERQSMVFKSVAIEQSEVSFYHDSDDAHDIIPVHARPDPSSASLTPCSTRARSRSPRIALRRIQPFLCLISSSTLASA